MVNRYARFDGNRCFALLYLIDLVWELLLDGRTAVRSRRFSRSGTKVPWQLGIRSGTVACSACHHPMLWFFERDDESLRLETRYDNDASEYVAIVRHPDGRKDTYRFAAAEAFRSWLLGFEESLRDEYWVSQSQPVILPDGWRKKRPM